MVGGPPRISGLPQTVRSLAVSEGAVRAVFLNGSYVTASATQDSDVDLTVLVTDEPAVQAVLDLLGERFTFQGCFHEVPHYRDRGRLIAVCVYPQGWTDDWVANAFRSADDLRQWQAWLQHKVIDAVALHDPGAILPRYQKQLSHYPDDLAIQIAAEALDYLQAEYLDSQPFRNVFHYAYCLRDILEHIGLALYALNRRFFAPPLKQRHRELPMLRPRIQNQLLRMVALSPDEPLHARRAPLRRIVAMLRR